MPTAIFAHRGLSLEYPENTISAFKAAEKAGADGIELDVQLSKDGVPMVIHDESLERTTNGSGFVRDCTARQLKTLSAGKWFGLRFRAGAIPSLQEVLDWLKPTGLQLNIELKNSRFPYEGMEEKVIRMIHDYHLSPRTIYSSFNHNSILKISKIDSEAATAPLCKRSKACPWKYIRSLNASGIHPHYRSVNRRVVETMHRHGIKVRPYTVNHVPIIKKLVSWNIDAVITDDARRAKKCLDKSKKNSAF